MERQTNDGELVVGKLLLEGAYRLDRTDETGGWQHRLLLASASRHQQHTTEPVSQTIARCSCCLVHNGKRSVRADGRRKRVEQQRSKRY